MGQMQRSRGFGCAAQSSWLGRGRRAQLQGEERSTPPFLSSRVSAIGQVSSTGNGGTKAFCKARPGRGCRSSGIGCQEAR